MKPPKENFRRVYKPNYTYTFFFVVMAGVMFVGALLVIKSTFSQSFLMVLVPMALQLMAWMICIPLVRAHFALVVHEEGIRGATGLLPFFSHKTTMKWERIRAIEIKDFALVNFIEIRDAKNDQKILIPQGIEHLEEFAAAIRAFSPANSPLRLIYQDNLARISSLRTIQVQVSGRCLGPRNKIFPLIPVNLKKGNLLINGTKTDIKGKFFLETTVIPGAYSLCIESFDYSGEIPVNIEHGYYSNLVIPVTNRNLRP